MKVALYARVSTDEQAKKYSIPAQLDLLRNFAKVNNYEIFKEYVDKGESGTISERPQLQELLNDARRGMFKIVLVYRIDRFFRNTRKLLNTVDELGKLGVSFKSVTEPFDTSNPTGNFMVSLLGSVAQLERDTFIQRSRMGTVKSAKSGNVLTGISLYGYRYNRKNLHYEVNEEEAKVVRETFRLYTESDSSLIKVAKKLNNLGYRTRNGLKWVSDRVHQILVSTAYYGKWYYRTKYHPEPIPVDVPSLIDRKLFDKAQRFLKERRIYSKRNTKNNYLLSHLLFCGVCGRSMAAMTKSMKSVYNGRPYGPYIRSYYYCFGQVKKKCSLPFVRVDRIDSLVWSKVKEILENPSLLIKVIKEREEKDEGRKVSLGARLKELDSEIGKCEQEKENILRAFRKGILDDIELASQIEDIRDQERALRQQQEEIKIQIIGQKQIKERLDHLSILVSGIQERLANFTFEEKRELMRTLVEKVTIYGSGKIELRVVVPEIMPSTVKEGEQRDLDSFMHSVLESATVFRHE